MYTPGSRKWSARRMRSPRRAPRENGLEGSTETTPIVRSVGADVLDERGDERRLPDSRRAGHADDRRLAGLGVELADERIRERVAVLDERDRPRERAAVSSRIPSVSSSSVQARRATSEHSSPGARATPRTLRQFKGAPRPTTHCEHNGEIHTGGTRECAECVSIRGSRERFQAPVRAPELRGLRGPSRLELASLLDLLEQDRDPLEAPAGRPVAAGAHRHGRGLGSGAGAGPGT